MKKFIFLIFLFISCNKKNDFEENLICSKKEWLYFDSNHNIDSVKYLKPIYYISFGRDLKWCNYFIRDKSRNYFSSCLDWSYNEKDSVLSMGQGRDMKFKILRYTTDTIYLKNFKGLREYLINIKHSRSLMPRKSHIKMTKVLKKH